MSLNSSDLTLLKQAFLDFCDKFCHLIPDVSLKQSWKQLRLMLTDEKIKPVDIMVFVQDIQISQQTNQQQQQTNPTHIKQPSNVRLQSQDVLKQNSSLQKLNFGSVKALPTDELPKVEIPRSFQDLGIIENSIKQVSKPKFLDDDLQGKILLNMAKSETNRVRRGSNLNVSNKKIDKSNVTRDTNQVVINPFVINIQSKIFLELKDASQNFQKNTQTLTYVYQRSFDIVSPASKQVKQQYQSPVKQEYIETKLVNKNFDEYARLAQIDLTKKQLNNLKDFSIYSKRFEDLISQTRNINIEKMTQPAKLGKFQRKIVL